MGGRRNEQERLTSNGSQCQVGVGVALVAVIPMLVFWYIGSVGQFQQSVAAEWWRIGLALLTLVIAVCGYILLHRHPHGIVRLRGHMEDMVRGELPGGEPVVHAEDDISAIEKGMSLLVDRLRRKAATAEGEKAVLQKQLYHAQKMETLGLMAGGVAHDFNNVMSAVLGHVNLMAMDLSDVENTRESVEDIRSMVGRAMELTNQMLTYAGKAEARSGPVDLSEVIRGVQKLFKVSVPKLIELKYTLADDLPGVIGDPTQVAQVALNLVMNASEAIGDGKRGTIECVTTAQACSADELAGMYPPENAVPGRFACLSVSDTGEGMTKESMARVFEPFYSTKVNGRGLGLAVVMGIVQGHGGLMSVESVPGEGTTFMALFPCDGSPKAPVD